MPDGADDIEHALTALTQLATPADLATLSALRDRLAQRRLRVLVAGEAKRGKSTLINRLLDRDVLPTGVTPVTAIATTVRRAIEAEYLDVAFHDGRHERRAAYDLAGLVTERANPENRLGVADVTLWLRSSLLRDYDLELVDTPGTGSVYAHNTGTAELAYGSLDAAIVVVSADPPISAAERDLLVRVDELAVRTFLVLNKTDQLEPTELDEAVQFTRATAQHALNRAIAVYPTSSRRGYEDPGFTAFAGAFRRYVAERAGADLVAAIRAHLARLAAAMLDAVLVTDRGLQFAASSSADRVQLFADRVAAITERRRDLADRAQAAQRRVIRQLAESGQQRTAQLIQQVRQHVQTLLDGELAALPGEEYERAGRAAVVERIREGVDAWRAEMSDLLTRELATIGSQGLVELDTQLADLRRAADELLGLALSVVAIESPLQLSRGFWYSFDQGVGWEPPLQEIARQVLPGRKQRARRRILDEIEPLTDRQVGRVRSDLAQRFKLSVSDAVKQLDAQHEQALVRVRYALDAIDKIRAAAASERDQHMAELTHRRIRLQGLLSSLSTPGILDEGEPTQGSNG